MVLTTPTIWKSVPARVSSRERRPYAADHRNPALGAKNSSATQKHVFLKHKRRPFPRCRRHHDRARSSFDMQIDELFECREINISIERHWG